MPDTTKPARNPFADVAPVLDNAVTIAPRVFEEAGIAPKEAQ